MFTPDDLDPPAPKQNLKDLGPMSLAELALYIESLKTEISRTEAEIAKKQRDKQAADAFFKS